jgi:hypothetical protein
VPRIAITRSITSGGMGFIYGGCVAAPCYNYAEAFRFAGSINIPPVLRGWRFSRLGLLHSLLPSSATPCHGPCQQASTDRDVLRFGRCVGELGCSARVNLSFF